MSEGAESLQGAAPESHSGSAPESPVKLLAQALNQISDLQSENSRLQQLLKSSAAQQSSQQPEAPQQPVARSTEPAASVEGLRGRIVELEQALSLAQKDKVMMQAQLRAWKSQLDAPGVRLAQGVLKLKEEAITQLKAQQGATEIMQDALISRLTGTQTGIAQQHSTEQQTAMAHHKQLASQYQSELETLRRELAGVQQDCIQLRQSALTAHKERDAISQQLVAASTRVKTQASDVQQLQLCELKGEQEATKRQLANLKAEASKQRHALEAAELRAEQAEKQAASAVMALAEQMEAARSSTKERNALVQQARLDERMTCIHNFRHALTIERSKVH